MLDLNSPAWEQLEGPYGSARKVPQLIRELQLRYEDAIKDELYWEELYHQNTIYSVTLAAVPYLAEIARLSRDPEVRLDVYITCGQFEADRGSEGASGLPVELESLAEEIGLETCQSIYNDYLTAISALAAYESEAMTVVAEAGKDLVEKRYTLAAAAAYRGWRGIARMLAQFCEGDEYVALCPDCSNDLYIWPSDGGELAAYAEDPVFEPDQSPVPIDPQEMVEGRPVSELYQLSRDIGETVLVRQLPYLTGKTSCPTCGVQLGLWSILTE